MGLFLLLAVYFWDRSDQPESEPDQPATPATGQVTPKPALVAEPGPPVTIYAESDNLIIEEVVSGLDIPWDIAFTPESVMLVNQRSGRLLARLADGRLQTVKADFSDLLVKGELGLMGMVVDPDFDDNRRFYTCQGDKKANQTKVVAWRINHDYNQAWRVDDPLVGGIPAASIHNGCRLRFDTAGYLWISTGDAAAGSGPQDLDSLAGKVLRVNARTGQAAADNPFDSSDRARLIYSFGHRNPQGLAWQKDFDQMWAIEHGPDTDDEINLLVKGGNYGWNPVSGSNNYYQSVPMTDTVRYPRAQVARWSSGKPTLAVAGGTFLEGDHWGSRQGQLAVATLKNSQLYLFQFDQNGRLQDSLVVPELDQTYGRLRSLVIGPDQALYLTTSNGGGEDLVLRIRPE